MFLDIDGVLNHYDAFAASKGSGNGTNVLADDCLTEYRRLLNLANPKGIILSSTWRLYDNNREYLNRFGVFWDYMTPDLSGVRTESGLYSSVPRRTEIKATLAVIDPNHDYPVLVLDDGRDADLREPWAWFVHTSMHTGLRPEHVDDAVSWLDSYPTKVFAKFWPEKFESEK